MFVSSHFVAEKFSLTKENRLYSFEQHAYIRLSWESSQKYISHIQHNSIRSHIKFAKVQMKYKCFQDAIFRTRYY